MYPGHAPFGYRNNKADRTIEIDPIDSPMVVRLMELYTTGAHTLSTLRKVLKNEFGKMMGRVKSISSSKIVFISGRFSGQERPTAAPIPGWIRG